MTYTLQLSNTTNENLGDTPGGGNDEANDMGEQAENGNGNTL